MPDSYVLTISFIVTEYPSFIGSKLWVYDLIYCPLKLEALESLTNNINIAYSN
jgi:hypothetical protein